MHVALAVEGGFYAWCSRALVRSLQAWPDVTVHVLHSWRLGPRSRLWYRRAGVRLHRVPDRAVAGLPAGGGFTQAMWFRCLLPDVLPEVDRVLYLDVDTLLLDDPAPLRELDLDGGWLAAVTNVPMPVHAGRAEPWGIPDERYFNSGVLLLDLQALRRTGAMVRVLDFARTHPDAAWPDQDALNVVLGDRRTPLAPRWNAMTSVLRFDSAPGLLGEGPVAEARARPAIRHFEGPGANKPWDPRAPEEDRALWARFT